MFPAVFIKEGKNPMRTELITEDSIWRCMSVLTPDEYGGWAEGRYRCFGTFDEDTGEVMGTASVQVFPEQIRLERIFTLPRYRRRGVATGLLRFLTDLPDELKLPFTAVLCDEDIDAEFLRKYGFKEKESDYSCIDAALGDIKELRVSEKMRAGITLLPAGRVSANELENFVFSSEHDMFLQFPEYMLDMDRFSDASMVCRQNGKITAAILLEEPGDYIRVTWFEGADARSLYCLIYMLGQILKEEYDPGTKIRVLLCGGRGRDAVGKMFNSAREHPLRIFTFIS